MSRDGADGWSSRLSAWQWVGVVVVALVAGAVGAVLLPLAVGDAIAEQSGPQGLGGLWVLSLIPVGGVLGLVTVVAHVATGITSGRAATTWLAIAIASSLCWAATGVGWIVAHLDTPLLDRSWLVATAAALGGALAASVTVAARGLPAVRRVATVALAGVAAAAAAAAAVGTTGVRPMRVDELRDAAVVEINRLAADRGWSGSVDTFGRGVWRVEDRDEAVEAVRRTMLRTADANGQGGFGVATVSSETGDVTLVTYLTTDDDDLEPGPDRTLPVARLTATGATGASQLEVNACCIPGRP